MNSHDQCDAAAMPAGKAARIAHRPNAAAPRRPPERTRTAAAPAVSH